jgi:hypothetical protein
MADKFIVVVVVVFEYDLGPKPRRLLGHRSFVLCEDDEHERVERGEVACVRFVTGEGQLVVDGGEEVVGGKVGGEIGGVTEVLSLVGRLESLD